MATKYHISKNGNIAECKATKRACPVMPDDDLDQFHSDDPREVENFMMRQYSDLNSGIVRKKFSKKFTVSDELIGTEETDVERLTEIKLLRYAQMEDRFWKAQTWLTDTENRPIAFIEFLKRDDKTVELCDIEVRPEFRGRKLAKRLVKAVERKMNVKMIHTGGYTADGLKSIAPLFHSEESLEEVKKQKTYSDMSFVMDWDRQYAHQS